MTKIGDIDWVLVDTTSDGRGKWQLGENYPYAAIFEYQNGFRWAVYLNDEEYYDYAFMPDFCAAKLQAENSLLDYMWGLNE